MCLGSQKSWMNSFERWILRQDTILCFEKSRRQISSDLPCRWRGSKCICRQTFPVKNVFPIHLNVHGYGIWPWIWCWIQGKVNPYFFISDAIYLKERSPNPNHLGDFIVMLLVIAKCTFGIAPSCFCFFTFLWMSCVFIYWIPPPPTNTLSFSMGTQKDLLKIIRYV